MASSVRTATRANRIPRRRTSRTLPASLPAPRGRPALVPRPSRPAHRPQPRLRLPREDRSRRSATDSTQRRAGPAPFSATARAPTPPLSSGARARPRRAHRDYALLPLPLEANPLRPPHPLTQPHTSRPPALREAEEVSHPLKNTHPRVPRYPPPGSPAQRALTAKLLRPLLTACPSQHEAPRTAQGTGPPKRTGSFLSANEAVTGPDAQTRKEGGRETLRGKGRGGRWRNRLRRLYRRGRFSVTREIPPTPPARPA